MCDAHETTSKEIKTLRHLQLLCELRKETGGFLRKV